jgi:MFS family permease
VIFDKVTVAGKLLVRDPKMKYMVGLNAVFGFTSAFLGSYVNGEVLPVALSDENGKMIGVLTGWTAFTAAGFSLLFGRLAPILGKGPILIGGGVCFMMVVLPFLVQPDAHTYNLASLLFVYTMQGESHSLSHFTHSGLFNILMFPPFHCSTLIRLSSLQGIGRATFEGTLKATFADFFSYEKEGAFGNIILQNGLAGAIGYFCTRFPS